MSSVRIRHRDLALALETNIKLFMEIPNYLKLPQGERQSHINLSSPCDFSGGGGGWRKNLMRKNLFLKLGIPYEPNIQKFGACVCHRCTNCRGKTERFCVNPEHLYLGTLSENSYDTHSDNPSLRKTQTMTSQPKAVVAALSEASRHKRIETFKKNKHGVGEKNSQHGTMWVTNGYNNLKIPKDGEIPEGYRKGRKM